MANDYSEQTGQKLRAHGGRRSGTCAYTATISEI